MILLASLGLLGTCDSRGPYEPLAPDGFARSLVPCSVSGVAPPTECGSFTVWEDRGAMSGRTIDLDVVVVRALDGGSDPDPVIFFQGGPGASSVALAPWLVGTLGRIRQTRDLVVIDQRGTGGSNPLACRGSLPSGEESLFGTLFPRDHIEACRAQLESRADLTHYATHDGVDDIAEAMRWLGYGKVNLFGASYGTRVALVFLRRHPDMVRTVLVNGVAPPDVNVHLHDAPNAERSLDWAIERCDADAACAAAHPEGLRADIDHLLRRFDGGPVSASALLSNGSTVTVPFSRGDLGYALRGMLYGQLADSIAPWVAASRQSGAWAGFTAYYVQRSNWVASGFATGMHLSVLCTEDYPLPPDNEVAAITEGTVLGESLARRYAAACELWPAGDLPAGFHDPIRSDLPVLIVSGERDPVTPATWGDAIASTLANSMHVVVPDAGHVPLTPCVTELQVSFFERGSTIGLAGC